MGCPIRIPLDHWLPAPPQSISPRGRVLLRPQAPRHPPYALHRGSLSAPHHRAPLPPETGKSQDLTVQCRHRSGGSPHVNHTVRIHPAVCRYPVGTTRYALHLSMYSATSSNSQAARSKRSARLSPLGPRHSLVEPRGLEPRTSAVQGRRSPN